MDTKELRELDAWLAEHVMELEPHERNTACYVRKGQKSCMMVGSEYMVSEWRPTTNAAQALLLLQKCAERIGCDCSISMCVKPKGFELIGCDNDLNIIGEVYAETLQLAICVFAKKVFSVSAE